MNCMVTYIYRGCQNTQMLNNVTESNWFQVFRSQCNYDDILSHMFIN